MSSSTPASVQQAPPISRVAVTTLGSLALMLTFVILFVAAFHDPRPNMVPVAVVGTSDKADALQAKVDGLGLGTFDVVAVASSDEARSAVRSQRVQAAVVPGPGQARVLVASAASSIEANIVQATLVRALGPMTVQDVRPLPRGDSKGLSEVFIVFGLTFTSLIASVWLLGHRAPARVLLGSLGLLSILGGLGVALIADFWFASLTGAFWPLTGIAALLVLAVAAAMSGLGRLAGRAGLALGVVVVVLLGVSSSGGPLGYMMQPDFFRTISQALPTGAAATALRHAVYFDSAPILQPVLVLVAWALAGVLAIIASGSQHAVLRRPRSAQDVHAQDQQNVAA
jgi:hypothetical protein